MEEFFYKKTTSITLSFLNIWTEEFHIVQSFSTTDFGVKVEDKVKERNI